MALKNYWGYKLVIFFAPDRRYAPDQIRNALRRRSPSCTAPASRSFSTSSTTTPRGNHLGPTHVLPRHRQSAYYWLVPDAAAVL